MMQALPIAICVLNAFFSFTAITLNIVTIIALRKPLTIPRAVKILLLSLAVSDLGVGLLVQPSYFTYLVMFIKENTPTRTSEITWRIHSFTSSSLAYASFFGVVALAADRFLAVYLHLRYQELVTHKRVVAVVISIWTISAILMLLMIWIPSNAIIFVPVDSVFYLTTAFFYFKIYLAVRHHGNQIHVLQAQLAQNNEGDMTNAARERKAAVGTFYVYLVFLICYLPITCFWIIHGSAGPSTMLSQFGFCTNTLMFLNSSLNPLIYSWKMRHVRHAVMEILRNILPYPHQWQKKKVKKLGNKVYVASLKIWINTPIYIFHSKFCHLGNFKARFLLLSESALTSRTATGNRAQVFFFFFAAVRKPLSKFLPVLIDNSYG